MILASGKHSSLLIHGVNNEEKKCFYNLPPSLNIKKILCQLDGLKKATVFVPEKFGWSNVSE